MHLRLTLMTRAMTQKTLLRICAACAQRRKNALRGPCPDQKYFPLTVLETIMEIIVHISQTTCQKRDLKHLHGTFFCGAIWQSGHFGFFHS